MPFHPRVDTTHYQQTLHPANAPYWSTPIALWDSKCAPLNVPFLTSLLKLFLDDLGKKVGKKRIASPQENIAPKRSRNASPMPTANGIEHPALDTATVGATEWNDKDVHVLQHIARISYSSDFASADGNSSLSYNVTELITLAAQCTEHATSPKTIDLGEFALDRQMGRFVAYTAKDSNPHSSWLCLLPAIPWPDDVDLSTSDYAWSTAHGSLLDALSDLEALGRIRVNCVLKAVIDPATSSVDVRPEFPIQIHAELNVSLPIPNIFSPISAASRRDTNRLLDLQRRLLSWIFPSEVPFPRCHHPVVDIPFFYSILHAAPRLHSDSVYEKIQPEALNPTLLPFQRKSVTWLLLREGKYVDESGTVASATEPVTTPFPWEPVIQVGGNTWYFNQLDGTLAPRCPQVERHLGAILAEEPGLGKTVECIAVILMNPAPQRNPSISSWDPEAKLEVKEVKTTLIVTPPSLASQWADELALHAPELKILVYNGWTTLKVPITPQEVAEEKAKRTQGTKRTKAMAQAAGDEVQDWYSYVNSFDVCITTYPTLQQDLAIARVPPTRPRREKATYSNITCPRSPLVLVEWHRVIMDEVQMQGGGKAEEMMSLIPRISSLAVSGTPARAQAADLIHVLKFLRFDGAVQPQRLWDRLLKQDYSPLFAKLFNDCAVRTMKSAVKDELTIPQQTRSLVAVELGPVERQVYDQSLEEALRELGLDARGVAASEGWQVDHAQLRMFLRRLRGLCTHPQVGQLMQRGDRLYKPGALKTMAEVLDAMRDQNWRNCAEDQRTRIQSLIRYAQLVQHQENDEHRYRIAYDILKTAENEADALIVEVQNALVQHKLKGDALKAETTMRRQNLGQQDDASGVGRRGGQSKPRSRSPSVSSADSDQPDEKGIPKTPAGEAHIAKGRGLRQRLRECLLVLHRVKFLQGDACHVLGGSHSTLEDESYAAAERLRRDLLKNTGQSASRAIEDLRHTSSARDIVESELLIKTPICGKGGIRSSDLFEQADEIVEGLINQQSKLLWEWRTKICVLLTQSLTSDGSDADGEEYARTLDTQGEAEIYLQAYASLLADRREALVAQRTLLATHDARELHMRKTNAARNAMGPADGGQDELQGGEVDLHPEHERLFEKLSEQRKDLLKAFEGLALKTVMIGLTTVVASIPKDTDPEKIIARDGANALRRLISSQGILLDKLDADLAKLRKTFNERILYFRQLQEISDSVADVEWEGQLRPAINECRAEQADLEVSLTNGRARQRFLDSLADNKDDVRIEEDEELCILCRCEFNRGFITQCAHVFCEGCLKEWLNRRQARSCPVCRAMIDVDQMQRFSVRDKNAKQDNDLPPKVVNGEMMPRSTRHIEYNRIDDKLFQEIENLESVGDYGSKIQTLVRHLLYLKITDPGAKSIVFSAWADSLHIVQHALRANNIPCLRIDQTKRKEKSGAKVFRDDPDMLVLLLHGERENAGLNVTCASRVFLLESVVHHGFEVQAIARIDRMGQRKATEVYCYYAEDTVERNILDLAARRGLSIYTKDNSTGTLDVSSLAVDTDDGIDSPVKKKAQKGDFISKADDMLAILFPHLFEDIQYLLPDLAPMDIDGTESHLEPSNAVAGPSRIH